MLLGNVALSADRDVCLRRFEFLTRYPPHLFGNERLCFADGGIGYVLKPPPVYLLLAFRVKLESSWFAPLQRVPAEASRHMLRPISSAVTGELGQKVIRLPHLLLKLTPVISLDLRLRLLFERMFLRLLNRLSPSALSLRALQLLVVDL